MPRAMPGLSHLVRWLVWRVLAAHVAIALRALLESPNPTPLTYLWLADALKSPAPPPVDMIKSPYKEHLYIYDKETRMLARLQLV